MSEVLVLIKRTLLRRRYEFSHKARSEMTLDNLTEEEVVESILNAPAIYKVLRSTSLMRRSRREMLYVIQGVTFSGKAVYTKGTLRKEEGVETYYFLVSSKRAL